MIMVKELKNKRQVYFHVNICICTPKQTLQKCKILSKKIIPTSYKNNYLLR